MGLEELTSEQIMTITWLAFIAVISYVFVLGVRSIIDLKISKNIRLNVKKELVKEVQNELSKPSLFESIRSWWVERKSKKEQDEMYKPLG